MRRLGFVADAYRARPLEKSDVLADIEAALRLSGKRGEASEAIGKVAFAGLTLDIPSHSLIDAEGNEIQLTRGEFAVLAALARGAARCCRATGCSMP